MCTSVVEELQQDICMLFSVLTVDLSGLKIGLKNKNEIIISKMRFTPVRKSTHLTFKQAYGKVLLSQPKSRAQIFEIKNRTLGTP